MADKADKMATKRIPKGQKRQGASKKVPTQAKRTITGRPGYAPTPENRDVVAVLAGGGIQQDTIAGVLDIDVKTLRKHFPDELSGGREKTKARIIGGLTGSALSGNITAQIFWLKAFGGVSDRPPPVFMGDDPLIPAQPGGQVVVYLPDNGRGDVDAGIVEVEVGRGA